jgi:hypothetical protein
LFLKLKNLFYRGEGIARTVADGTIRAEVVRRKAEYNNPLGRCSGKTFSQSDEDGIIAEILRRIGLSGGTYCEFGVGDGLECNTLALAAQGWRGFWISGQPISFSLGGVDPQFFRFDQSWVDLDNIVTLFRRNAEAMGLQQVDLLSFDLDSRDLFFLDLLLSEGLRPSIVIAEYNAKFRPPIRWSVPRDDPTPWQGSDYMGASLASLDDLFSRYGYRLIACNPATGGNAFFIRDDLVRHFDDVPRELDQLYVEPYYDLPRHGHRSDPRTALQAIMIGQATNRGEKQPEFSRGGSS